MSPSAFRSHRGGRGQSKHSWWQIERVWGRKTSLGTIKGLQVSSPISAQPALAYRWRKPHLSGLSQKCTLNKTEVGSSCPKPQPYSPRKVPPTLPSPWPPLPLTCRPQRSLRWRSSMTAAPWCP